VLVKKFFFAVTETESDVCFSFSFASMMMGSFHSVLASGYPAFFFSFRFVFLTNICIAWGGGRFAAVFFIRSIRWFGFDFMGYGDFFMCRADKVYWESHVSMPCV